MYPRLKIIIIIIQTVSIRSKSTHTHTKDKKNELIEEILCAKKTISEHLNYIQRRNHEFVLLFVSVEDDDDDDDDNERSSFVPNGWVPFDPLAMFSEVSRSSSNGFVKASSRPAMVISSPKLEEENRWLDGRRTEGFTVLIGENREIVGIFEMYFLQLHRIDLVVVVPDHFSQESNQSNLRSISPPSAWIFPNLLKLFFQLFLSLSFFS